MTDHNELRALALAATPGPWEYSTAGLGATDGSFILTEHFVRRPGDDVAIAAEIINPDDCKTSEDNAAYIAAANPATVLALLDEVEAAHASRREAQARVAELTEKVQALGRGQKWSVINGIGDALSDKELDAAVYKAWEGCAMTTQNYDDSGSVSSPPKPRWYCLSIDGAATLCIDQADAVETALDADLAFPSGAPHRAVQMVELPRKGTGND